MRRSPRAGRGEAFDYERVRELMCELPEAEEVREMEAYQSARRRHPHLPDLPHPRDGYRVFPSLATCGC